MKNTPDVSIIVPVYNVEKYLRECVDSLIRQTLKNIEIILVDDGSSDSSGAICDEYMQKDSRIKVIHKRNEKQHLARISGLKEASSPFITFCDADDRLMPNAVESMYISLNHENADLAIGGTIRGSKKNTRAKRPVDNEVIVVSDFNELPYKMNSLWGKLYKKEIIKKSFDSVPVFIDHEDFPVYTKYLSQIKKIVVVNGFCYWYRQRKSSWSHSAVSDTENIISMWNYYNNEFNNFLNEKDFDYLKKVLWNDAIRKIPFDKHAKQQKKEIEWIFKDFNINRFNLLWRIKSFLFSHNCFLCCRILVYCYNQVTMKNFFD